MCIERYGEEVDRLMTLFNPGRQAEYALRKERCYTGTAPRIGTMAEAYGANVAIAWLEIQIRDLSKYSGCKDKMTNVQVTETAMHILADWTHLKLTEFMLFFHYMKGGRYGHFYGAVDGMRITEALTDFSRTRAIEIAAIEEAKARDAKEAEERRHRANSVSEEEWKEIRELEAWTMWAGFMTPDTWSQY